MNTPSSAGYRTLHFDLGVGANSTYTLHVGLDEYRVSAHDDGSRERFRKLNAVLTLIPNERLTHFVEGVRMPEAVTLLQVTTPRNYAEHEIQAHVVLSIHTPSANLLAARSRLSQGAVDPKLERLGVSVEQANALGAGFDACHPQGLDDWLDSVDTARTLVFLHPQLTNLDSDVAASVRQHTDAADITPLADKIDSLGPEWTKLEPVLDVEGQPVLDSESGKPLFTNVPSPELEGVFQGPLRRTMATSSNDSALEGEIWTVEDGVTAQVCTPMVEDEGVIATPPGVTPADDGYIWRTRVLGSEAGLSVDPDSIRYTPGDRNGTLSVQCTNSFLRHLGAYVQFLDVAGNPVPNPNPDPVWLPISMVSPDPTYRFVDVVGPVKTFRGVPLPADPTELKVRVPDQAHTVRLLYGGLGVSSIQDPPNLIALGAQLTVLLEYELTIFLLVAGDAAQRSGLVDEILENKKMLISVIAAGVGGGVVEECLRTGNPKPFLTWVAKVGVSILLGSLVKKAIEKILVKAAVKKAVPIAGEIMFALSAIIAAAEIGQTVYAMAASPFIIEATVERFMQLAVTLVPDTRFRKFPDLAVRCAVVVTYDVGTTSYEVQHNLNGVKSDPIPILFSSVPAGGRLKAAAYFYAANDWIAGSGETQIWVDAKPGSDNRLELPELEIKTKRVPIRSDTQYLHKAKLAYENGYVWQTTPQAPKATFRSLDPSPERPSLAALGRITVAQYPAMVGYGFQAFGLNVPKDDPHSQPSKDSLYTFQNISILEHPEKAYYSPNLGFSRETPLVYELEGAPDGTGLNFFLDRRKAPFRDSERGTGSHLRRLKLGSDADFRQLPKTSYGVFPLSPDAFAVHPNGYALAVNTANSKLQILKMSREPRDDVHAPKARLISGEGQRPGLVAGPLAVATTLRGHFVVLESLNYRIQAFDASGNPVRVFRGNRHWMPLHDPPGAGTRYLDMGVEAKGYLYVLAYTGEGADPNDYHLTIYSPEGAFMTRTQGIAAGAIAVSYLRNVFTLNYEQIKGYRGRPEPSISFWIPTPPPPK